MDGFRMKDIKKKYLYRWQSLEPVIVEQDEWGEGAECIFDEDKLAEIEQYVENIGCIIVDHGHYRGASAPTRFVTDDFEEFTEYLQDKTVPGDSIVIYRYPHEAKPLTDGKCPDKRGRVPKYGFY